MGRRGYPPEFLTQGLGPFESVSEREFGVHAASAVEAAGVLVDLPDQIGTERVADEGSGVPLLRRPVR